MRELNTPLFHKAGFQHKKTGYHYNVKKQTYYLHALTSMRYTNTAHMQTMQPGDKRQQHIRTGNNLFYC